MKMVPKMAPTLYHHAMAMNLRLRPEAAEALRLEAQRVGRSQQELVREAVDRYLGLTTDGLGATQPPGLYASGQLEPARRPFRRAEKRLKLPLGITSSDLLDREDRL